MPQLDFNYYADREYAAGADGYAASDEQKWKSPSTTARRLATACGERVPDRILELGVGTGRYFPFLRGRSYTGVDVCDPMLHHARLRVSILQERGFEAVHLVCRNIEEYLQQHRSFSERPDFVFSIGCIGYHVPVTGELMRQIAGVMAPGGRLFLQTTQPSAGRQLLNWLRHARSRLRGVADMYPFFTAAGPARLRAAAHSAGLRIVWIQQDEERLFFDRPLLLSLFEKL